MISATPPEQSSLKRLREWAKQATPDTGADFRAQLDHFNQSANRLMAADGQDGVDFDPKAGGVCLQRTVQLQEGQGLSTVTLSESLKSDQEAINLKVVSQAIPGAGFGFALENLGQSNELLEEVHYEVRPDSSKITVTKRALGAAGNQLQPRKYTMDLEQQTLLADPKSKKEFLANLIDRQENKVKRVAQIEETANRGLEKVKKQYAHVDQKIAEFEALGQEGEADLERFVARKRSLQQQQTDLELRQSGARQNGVEYARASRENRATLEHL